MKEFPITFQTPLLLFNAKDNLFKKINELGLNIKDVGVFDDEEDNEVNEDNEED